MLYFLSHSSPLSVGISMELSGRREVAEFRLFRFSLGFVALRSFIAADAGVRRGAAHPGTVARRRTGDRVQRQSSRGEMVYRYVVHCGERIR